VILAEHQRCILSQGLLTQSHLAALHQQKTQAQQQLLQNLHLQLITLTTNNDSKQAGLLSPCKSPVLLLSESSGSYQDQQENLARP